MTRVFGTYTDCPHCHTRHTAENSLGRWIRNNPSLRSQAGYSVCDVDLRVDEIKIMHQYKGMYGREFQLIMDVEVKCCGADLSPTQRDSLHMRNQLMRNRRQTPTKKLRYQAGTVSEVFSTMNGRRVLVRAYGVHVLRFSGLGPDDSEWIKWDGKEISAEQLTEILAFNLDPDTLKPIDLRNHHAVANINQIALIPGIKEKQDIAA